MSTGTSLANPSNAGKETVYVDVDDEITTIIDKVRSSPQKIVALVLPKRATMLQSVVNMKLLKRTADNAKKNLVLITTEPSLLSLAGGIGLHVAKNLQSKPEIPDAPQLQERPDGSEEEALSMDDGKPDGPELDASKSVGELAVGGIPTAAIEDTIDLDDSESDGAPSSGNPATVAAKAKKDKKANKKVPNFNRFRLMLVLGVVAIVLLIAAWVVCFDVLPKATVLVKTNASNVPVSLTVNLNTTAPNVNAASNTMPAQIQQVPKSYSQQAPATGQQNNGTKATGTVQFYDCNQGDTLSGTATTIPAGSGISANGLTFITDTSVTVFPSHFNGNNCKQDQKSAPVEVTAQNAGSQYNIGSATYAVAGFSSILGAGSNMTGGTDNITKIVEQADIDGAKQKLATQDTSTVKQQLISAFQNVGLYPIQSSFQAGTPNITSSANAGDPADSVTVSETITYTMFGVKQQDLSQIVTAAVDKQINTSKQVILDDGLGSATFTVQSQDGASKAAVSLQDTAVAGPDLKVDTLKSQIAGKKAADAMAVIKANPGVTDVSVSYRPFWVSSVPKNTSKISIVIEKPSQNASGS